ncbi:hypothetical protein E3N88_29511 [Mikania micrantha]|uniref:Uncharacterized protein n=1 Tax=Mikania micrantha TaxID=192012 RepID=A0A5N6MJL7_9ASTR|nr:hypothetical protein E3N88_29511 [Mikania micrantha]
MMNVGENRVQNGVLDCPKSKNEEKFLSIERMDSSRYAMEGLRVLRGTRCLENILDSRISSRYAKPNLASGREVYQTKFEASKQPSEATRSHQSQQESFLQVLIIVLTADIRQIRTSACSFTGLLKPSTEIDGSYCLTRRVPRQGAQKGFAYSEEIRRISDILVHRVSRSILNHFVAYCDESKIPYFEIFLRFAIPDNP